MENNLDNTPEEIQKMIEKAQAELQAKLDAMPPEERRQAELKAKQAIEEDAALMQSILYDANRIAGKNAPEKEKLCPNCGAPAGEGNSCAYCGSQLK